MTKLGEVLAVPVRADVYGMSWAIFANGSQYIPFVQKLTKPQALVLAEAINTHDRMREALEAVEKIVAKHTQWPACEKLGPMDWETGATECSMDTRGGSCLCIERVETAEKIAAEIRAIITPKGSPNATL